MAQVVDPRSAALSGRGLAQADGLADLREVPLREVCAGPPSALGLEERAASGVGDDPAAEVLAGLQLRDHALGDRNDAAPPVLAAPDEEGGVLGVDIPVIEPEAVILILNF